MIASVISLDCDEGVCPLVIDTVATCQVTDRGSNTVVRWTVPDGQVPAISQAVPTGQGFGYTAMFVGNGVTTLSANATTDRNTTAVQCLDGTDADSDTCTINIAG